MKKALATFATAVAAVLFLGIGWKSWLSREVVVEIGLKAPDPASCSLFWTEASGDSVEPTKRERMAFGPGGASVKIRIPAARLSRIRLEPDGASGTLRASRMLVSGKTRTFFDWRTARRGRGVAFVGVDGKGAADIVWNGPDAFLENLDDLGVEGRWRVVWGGVCFRLAVLVLLWLAVADALGFPRSRPDRAGGSIPGILFFSAAAVLVAARMALTARIPPYFGPSVWDDVWFAKASCFLANGEWLGPYDCHTLCKGFFGPAVAAFASSLGIPFLLAETLLHIAGCCFSVYVLSRIFPNRSLLLLSLLVLLMNPVSWAPGTWQSVYRNGMPVWLVPLVTGSFFLLFLATSGSLGRMFFLSVCAGLSMWAFLNTREDGVWLWPYALSCTAATFLRIGKRDPFAVRRRLTCLVPILLVVCGNSALSAVNWRIYGKFIRNDRDAGNYAKAMKDLYLIEPDPEDEKRLSGPTCEGHYHNIYYSTVCKAYEASPTLASIRPFVDRKIDEWRGYQRCHSRDLYLDHMLFAIREGAADAGLYRSLPVGEKFFGDIHDELSHAFGDGRLRRRGVSLTAMAAPFRPEMLPRIFREWGDTLRFVFRFRGFRLLPPERWGNNPLSEEQRRFFESASGGRMVFGAAALPLGPDVSRINAVANAFERVIPHVIALALLAHAVLSFPLLFAFRRFRSVFPGWLLSTGILACVLVHTACIAYVKATTFDASKYWYLAASFELSLLFVCSVAVTGLGALSAARSEASSKES